MKEAQVAFRDIMEIELSAIGDAMIEQIIARARRLPPSQRLNAIKEINWPGENDYQRNILELMAEVSLDAIAQARKEVPKAKNVQLFEHLDSIKLASQTVLLDKLPRSLQDKFRKQAQLLVGTQLADLEKNLFYQYTDSYDTTDDMDVVNADLKAVAVEFIDGQSVRAGASVLASKIVNESRNAFFFDSETLEELEAFQFVNGDPVTPICQDLAGTVFAKDDPEMFRYTPPLHWNCKSYIVPILKGNLGNRSIEKLQPSTKKIEDTIQFSECEHDHSIK